MWFIITRKCMCVCVNVVHNNKEMYVRALFDLVFQLFPTQQRLLHQDLRTQRQSDFCLFLEDFLVRADAGAEAA